MASVTQRIKTIRQPRGGYVDPKMFSITKLEDHKSLAKFENIHPRLVGLAVDYLTRSITSKQPVDAFKISLMGAAIIGEEKQAIAKAQTIVDLSESSVINACQLSGYDDYFRVDKVDREELMSELEPVTSIMPDRVTINNIVLMVQRSLVFFSKYGPVVQNGFTFEGGYTAIVDKGDGDFITADTLWDFKVSRNDPQTQHTLQLLMYYLMGMRSIHKQLHAIKRLGIFNPRLNVVYLLDTAHIAPAIIKTVEKDVIGYLVDLPASC